MPRVNPLHVAGELDRRDPADVVYELATELERAVAREGELRDHLRQMHLQLAERDALIGQLSALPGAGWSPVGEAERDVLAAENSVLAAERDRLGLELQAMAARLHAAQTTRVWRAARLWWRLKARLGGG